MACFYKIINNAILHCHTKYNIINFFQLPIPLYMYIGGQLGKKYISYLSELQTLAAQNHNKFCNAIFVLTKKP